MDVITRAAVRIVCLDADDRVLLLQWRDPFDGAVIWALPGGGIETGESPLHAARRELVEETGLDPAAIVDGSVMVPRDSTFGGRRIVGPEDYFLARYPDGQPVLTRHGEGYEVDCLTGHAWLTPDDLSHLDGRLEPPTLAAAIAELAPDTAWIRSG